MCIVVMSDFDGTIVYRDTANYVLAKFAKGEWKIYDKKFAEGEMTLEECVQKQFSFIRVPKQLILKELENIVHFRPNFQKLAEYCDAHAVPLIIVSAGLDFVIKHFLKLENCLRRVEICAANTRFTANGVELIFPKLRYKTSRNFKDDLVRYYKKHNKQVIYVGDGAGDVQAVRIADFPFVIKDSELAKSCKKMNIPHEEIEDFQRVIETIESISKR
jgi:2-hydroxy-3-keto-5-methylthiopentenyl-1-phosphate phosphatase